MPRYDNVLQTNKKSLLDRLFKLMFLHVPSVLTPYFKQGFGYLT